ncbi:hypothetical protein [Hymenobacter fodinae]|uniref:Uncharacterized protein n=1 Tax=Hymenobacter fodinae TaxID=2510796 RepID=A0A4Z0P5D4_9BACT|nr:hypothetical protein [Hymenobacter fodinae]TGE05586.1 hypothetical protein EU556_20000 [Hymenobacter fodinae]
MGPLKGAQNSLTTNPRTQEATTTPAQGPASQEDRQNTGKKPDPTPARLRPQFQVGTFEGFNGKRFVAHGLTEEQAQGLKAAAQALGVREV